MMNSVAEILERESTTVDLEPGHFERMLRRRDRKHRNQRIRAGAVAILVLVVTVLGLARALNVEDRTAVDPHPPNFTDTVITYTADPRSWGDLVAQDPDTGEVRTLVDAHSIDSEFRDRLINWAAPSADGKWVAFEVSTCGNDGSGSAAIGGLWITNGVDEPRQLTKPCFGNPEMALQDGFWEWSPTGAQLVVAVGSADGDALVLIDPEDGDRTDLGNTAGDVTSLAWSPDGTRIAYGAVPTGTRNDDSPIPGSVYSVEVGGGDHSLLASQLGDISGGEMGSGIRWSPDGARIAVLAQAEENELYLMNADGSDLELLTEGVVIAHILGSPNLVWSPDGGRMAYATLSRGRDEWQLQIWNGSADGSTPILVFESPPVSEAGIWLSGGPVWSPDGRRIAFRYSPTNDEHEALRLVANADGTGRPREIDELSYRSWRGGWYFCECYG
jgi:Tol biopolymer transport system component